MSQRKRAGNYVDFEEGRETLSLVPVKNMKDVAAVHKMIIYADWGITKLFSDPSVIKSTA